MENRNHIRFKVSLRALGVRFMNFCLKNHKLAFTNPGPEKQDINLCIIPPLEAGKPQEQGLGPPTVASQCTQELTDWWLLVSETAAQRYTLLWVPCLTSS